MFNYLETLQEYGDRCAYRILDGANVTEKSYRRYLKDANIAAARLEEKFGDITGKHIGIYENSSYEYAALLAAIIFSRAVAVPLNNLETAENISFAIKTAKLDGLIADNWTFSDPGVQVISISEILTGKITDKRLSDFGDDEADRESLIIFTSGTTSLSKGVVISAKSLFGGKKVALPKACMAGKLDCVGMRAYTNFPLYHIGGICVWLSWTTHGCTTYLSRDPRAILTDLESQVLDTAGVVPATLNLWMNSLRRGHYDRLGRVKHVMTGGAAIAPEVVKEYLDHDITVAQYYGMSELGGFVTCNYDSVGHASSAGQAIDDVEIQIIDGEICIKYWGNMQGYIDNEEATKETLKDGMMYTGDLGYIDNEGYLFITGRKKNLIILSSGENVSPEELEGFLYKNPSVKECKVYEKDDRIHAGIFCETGDQEDIKRYVADLNKRTPIYKRIYTIDFRDTAFEKTASGKIKR